MTAILEQYDETTYIACILLSVLLEYISLFLMTVQTAIKTLFTTALYCVTFDIVKISIQHHPLQESDLCL